MHHHKHHIAAIAFAAGLSLWTAAGQTSDPVLSVYELPAEVRNDCAATPVANTASICAAEDSYTSRWVGRSTGGDVFVVARTVCAADGCRAWLVQRSDGVARTLLAVNGEFRLLRAGANAYPAVQERTMLSNDYVRYSRFAWNGTNYVRTETRLVHAVDGFECGTTDECNDAARAALDGNDAGRAVRIWQHVHGVAWI